MISVPIDVAENVNWQFMSHFLKSMLNHDADVAHCEEMLLRIAQRMFGIKTVCKDYQPP